jgi:hypothetical protein
VATLRIQVLRPRTSPLQEIKDKLLRLLLVHSHGLLMSTGCPLDEVFRTSQSNLSRYLARIVSKHFNSRWFNNRKSTQHVIHPRNLICTKVTRFGSKKRGISHLFGAEKARQTHSAKWGLCPPPLHNATYNLPTSVL